MARVDRGERVIKAPPLKIYEALTSAAAVAQWRPPAGISARIYQFDPREDGPFRMAFVYDDPSVDGKSGANEDVFSGIFVKLVPGERVVERVLFESDDPAFAGVMTITTTIAPAPEGSLVEVRIEDVPPGITAEDHAAGIASSLANLAAFVE